MLVMVVASSTGTKENEAELVECCWKIRMLGNRWEHLWASTWDKNSAQHLCEFQLFEKHHFWFTDVLAVAPHEGCNRRCGDMWREGNWQGSTWWDLNCLDLKTLPGFVPGELIANAWRVFMLPQQMQKRATYNHSERHWWGYPSQTQEVFFSLWFGAMPARERVRIFNHK